MSTNAVDNHSEVMQPSVDEIATEVALILKRKLDARDIMHLLEVVSSTLMKLPHCSESDPKRYGLGCHKYAAFSGR